VCRDFWKPSRTSGPFRKSFVVATIYDWVKSLDEIWQPAFLGVVDAVASGEVPRRPRRPLKLAKFSARRPGGAAVESTEIAHRAHAKRLQLIVTQSQDTLIVAAIAML
jgi:hypothetical protein